MIADEVGEPYIPHYLWKLLIDERYQRQGVETATLALIVGPFLDRPSVVSITTSAVEARITDPFLRTLRLRPHGENHASKWSFVWISGNTRLSVDALKVGDRHRKEFP